MSRVTSKFQIVSEVIIDGNYLKICFHIVPDESINSDIIIGREILGMGVKVILTANACIFTPIDLNLSKSITKKFDQKIQMPSENSEVTKVIDPSSTLSVITREHTDSSDNNEFQSVYDHTYNELTPSDCMPCEQLPIDRVVESISNNFDNSTPDIQNETTFDQIRTEIDPARSCCIILEKLILPMLLKL